MGRKLQLNSLKSKIVGHYMLVISITLLLVGVVFSLFMHSYYYVGIERTLTSYSDVTSSVIKSLGISDEESLEQEATYLLNVVKNNDTTVQIIDLNQSVITSSSGFEVKENIDTIDVQQAIQGNRSSWQGRNEATNERIFAVSTPIVSHDKTIGVLRYITSIEATKKILRNIYTASIVVGVCIMAIVFLISFTLANSITRPIRTMTEASKQMAQGRFNIKLNEDYEAEIGTLAKTLNYMADEIVKSDNVKNEFISSVSHELRTPLTSIKGWSETMLLGDLADKEETKLAFNIISSETNRLIGLVEELLDFSQFQAGKIKLSLTNVSLSDIVDEVIFQYRLKSEKKNIHLQCLIQATPFILADQNRIKQVLINLIDNAMKYSPPHTKITVVIKEDRRNAILQVIDEGIGISSEHIKKVKQSFYQVNANKEGTGLGLAIVQQIVQLHNGTLRIHSHPSKGTAVTISFAKSIQKKRESPFS
ncbi:sensor histidine kinase [Priestia taiwanensis]|uniref:histidine kinase n=1 Tax=Priestia taiwanensis TaxID=1347902 RepID=A0A917ESA9_9BACI|nr:HAMP domain-containing sensor histidine kinase [Priestia taiwanensis]MBM7364314.1 signal transduction histidine kinase [Priestia taiwanensis]GGE73452.1 sensor histidine kinase [Priestia taiwanensis]